MSPKKKRQPRPSPAVNMNVLDLMPSRRANESSEATAVLSAEIDGVLETRIVTIRDLRILLARTLSSLAFHGDIQARAILQGHFANQAMSTTWEDELIDTKAPLTYRANQQPAAESPKSFDDIPVLAPINLRVRGKRKHFTIGAVGAYSIERTIIVLGKTKMPGYDLAVVRLDDGKCATLLPEDAGQYLPKRLWRRFIRLPDRATIEFGKHVAQKLDAGHVQRLLQEKIFAFTKPTTNSTPIEFDQSPELNGVPRIEVPDFVFTLLADQQCDICKTKYGRGDIVKAGIRRHDDNHTYFFYEVECSKCSEPSQTTMTSRPMDSREFKLVVEKMYADRDKKPG